jgi:hypothetical protein
MRLPLLLHLTFLGLSFGWTSWSATLRGSVVEDHSGHAVVSAELRIARKGVAQLVADLESDGDGRFEPVDLEDGDLFMDEYNVRIHGVPSDSYLKETSYAGISVLSAPIVPGSRGDSTMRIVLGRDGGVINAKVVDKDGVPIPDAALVILPADITSPALLADSLIRASTDQNGNYTSARLAPGKYIVIATEASIDSSMDSIDKLWTVRNKAQSIDLAPNGTAGVSVELTSIN